MPLLRDRFFWIPLYLFLFIVLVKKYGKQGVIILLFFVATFGIADFFSASVIKPVVERLRPCNDPLIKAYVHSVVPCGTGHSFPSTHATNHFAMAIFLVTVFYQRWKYILPLTLLWAFSIGFAQIYVGLHYPLDVFGGGCIGSIIGYLTGKIYLSRYQSTSSLLKNNNHQ